eukprot:CAMPEP_0201633650 /NCGR_PEP_ID=MMETSP0493-20130528/6890_1 /ASSEMBLY_ACC=CAM_ASM_000838 /TAXON_ID=420259 /ORGANISM="Thalassiosira gravida, Strain GMp14c1" /LENGTH=101 /DNA_ID=CAMNT_0048105393 /DNA_START=119 /DNA_END=424 /DNA_ORIENTATION=+
MVQPNDVVNVVAFFDEWTRCIGSGFQKDSLYRFGRFDGCYAQWKDIRIAMKAKTNTDSNEATKLLETTHYHKNLGSNDPKTSPTAGVIWDLKDEPGWYEDV